VPMVELDNDQSKWPLNHMLCLS